jgi:DNA-binding transcriptional regulator YiaG
MKKNYKIFLKAEHNEDRSYWYARLVLKSGNYIQITSKIDDHDLSDITVAQAIKVGIVSPNILEFDDILGDDILKLDFLIPEIMYEMQGAEEEAKKGWVKIKTQYLLNEYLKNIKENKYLSFVLFSLDGFDLDGFDNKYIIYGLTADDKAKAKEFFEKLKSEGLGVSKNIDLEEAKKFLADKIENNINRQLDFEKKYSQLRNNELHIFSLTQKKRTPPLKITQPTGVSLRDRILSLRKSKKLNPKMLAEKLGVSESAVQKWEKGEANPCKPVQILLALLEQGKF